MNYTKYGDFGLKFPIFHILGKKVFKKTTLSENIRFYLHWFTVIGNQQNFYQFPLAFEVWFPLGFHLNFPWRSKLGLGFELTILRRKFKKKTLNYLSSEIRKETRMLIMKTEAKIDEISNHEAKIVLKMTILPFFRSRKFMRRILELSGF